MESMHTTDIILSVNRILRRYFLWSRLANWISSFQRKVNYYGFKFLHHVYFLSYSVVFIFGKKSTRVWAQDWVSEDLCLFSYFATDFLCVLHCTFSPPFDTTNAEQDKQMAQKNLQVRLIPCYT